MQTPPLPPGAIRTGATPIRRQRGSMAIAMMLMLLGLITILGIVEVGYLYWAHRDAQKVADLAALSGAQQLSGPTCITGSPAYVAASGNATDNGGTPVNGYSSIGISCGRQPASGSSILSPASASSVAAIKVVANRSVNHIFGMAWKSTFPIKAEAVAVNQHPIASFSIGSQLVGISTDSLLNKLLGSTLDTSIGLSLLSSSGITGTNISLLGLVKNLPVDIGSLSSVLDTQVHVSQILDAYVTALKQSSNAATIKLSVVEQQIASIEGQIGDPTINLGQILNVNAWTSDPSTALGVDVNAADILNAVILAADSKNALAIPGASIKIPGIANVALTLSVIEPPQIGVGGVGTTAHTAQIRLAADISALSVVNLGGEPVSDLSVAVEVAPSEGTITDITCNVPNADGMTDNVTIHVVPKAANAGILDPSYAAQAVRNTSQSWSSILDAAKADKTKKSWDKVVDVLGLVKIQLFTDAQVQATPDFSHQFEVDPSKPISDQTDMTYPKSLDSDPATESDLLVSSLLASDVQANISIIGGLLNLNVSDVLNTLSPLLSALLAPVLKGVVNPLLQAVGLEVGTAQINLRSVTCNSGAQLVY